MIDSHEVFDPNIEPLVENILVPDNDPTFVTDLAILSAAGNDPAKAMIITKQFYLGVDFVNGKIGPDELVKGYAQLDKDKKAYVDLQALHNQK